MRRLQNIQNILKMNKNIESELILFWPKKTKKKNKSENITKWKGGGVKKSKRKKNELNKLDSIFQKYVSDDFFFLKMSMQFFMHLIKIEQKINLNINIAC